MVPVFRYTFFKKVKATAAATFSIPFATREARRELYGAAPLYATGSLSSFPKASGTMACLGKLAQSEPRCLAKQIRYFLAGFCSSRKRWKGSWMSFSQPHMPSLIPPHKVPLARPSETLSRRGLPAPADFLPVPIRVTITRQPFTRVLASLPRGSSRVLPPRHSTQALASARPSPPHATCRVRMPLGG